MKRSVHARVDDWDSAGAGVGCPGDGPVPQARGEFADILQVESEVGRSEPDRSSSVEASRSGVLLMRPAAR